MRLLLILFFSSPLFATVTYQQVKPIIDKQCASCHRGPFLDLRDFPFVWDMADTQEEVVIEMLKRVQMPDRDRMPPINFPRLKDHEVEILKAWQAGGLLP